MKPAISPCAARLRSHLASCEECEYETNAPLKHCEYGEKLMRAALDEYAEQHSGKRAEGKS